MLRRLSSTFLTVAFAALSVLGHGGLHLLPGGCGAHHTHTDYGQSVDSHAHRHCCSHGHCHDGDDGPESPSDPTPFDHDHDNCPVCQWHAQGQITAIDVVVPQAETCKLRISQAESQVASTYRLTTLFSRGPPLQG